MARRRWAVNIMCLLLVISFFICRFPICLRNTLDYIGRSSIFKSKSILDTEKPGVQEFLHFSDTLYMLDATLFPIIIQTVFNTCFRTALLSILCCPFVCCRRCDACVQSDGDNDEDNDFDLRRSSHHRSSTSVTVSSRLSLSSSR